MANKPNIIFMLADNVGWGDLSCYGGLVPTLRLDQLAAEGTRFTNFNTEAQCTPTRGALLTGRMPIRTGTYKVPLPGEHGHYGLSPWEYTSASNDGRLILSLSASMRHRACNFLLIPGRATVKNILDSMRNTVSCIALT